MDHRTVMDLAGTDAAAYIRKSRLEEGMDTQEVLSKHQKALVEYAAATRSTSLRSIRGGQRRIPLCPAPDAPAPPGCGGGPL